MELHSDDEPWIGDERMYKAFCWSDYTIETHRRWIVGTEREIQEKLDNLVLLRRTLAFLERLEDPEYKRAVTNRLQWENRETIRKGFMYIQTVRKIVPADPSHILRNSRCDFMYNGAMISFDHIHRAMGGYVEGCYAKDYLLKLLDAFVWCRCIPDGDRAIASRVVQFLV